MSPRLLLDTHVLLRWFFEVKRLTRDQVRVLNHAMQRGEPVALSAISLIEVATLWGDGKLQLRTPLQEFLDELQSNSAFQVLPLTFEIASDVAHLGVLRDPADRTIVGTSRVHRLRLVTSDQRIIESALVPVIS